MYKLAKRWGGLLFFGVYLVIGVTLAWHTGEGWDDEIMRENAVRNWKWAIDFLQGNAASWEAIFHGNIDETGPAIQLFFVGIERLLGITDVTTITAVHHVLGFLLVAIGSLAIFKLGALLGFNKILQWVLWGLIVFHPRIFGHSLFNTKDPVFMIMGVVSVWLILSAMRNNALWRFAVAGGFLGFIVDIRLIGLVFLVPWLPYIFERWRSIDVWKQIAVFGGSTLVAIVIFWPFLWNNPLELFWQQFAVITEVKQPNPTLFEGEFYDPGNAPRYYLWAYLGYTIPIALLGMYLVGVFRFISRFKSWSQLQRIAGWTAFTIPCLTLAMSSLMQPIFYNGWRHFQYIYPWMVLFAVWGFSTFKRANWMVHKRHLCAGILVIIGVGAMLYNTVTFPHGHLYMNPWVSGPMEQQFERDYWGVEFRQGWEELARIEKGTAVVFVSDFPGRVNKKWLNDSDIQRFSITSDWTKADYILSNFCHFESFSTPLWYQFYFGEHRPALGEEVFSLESRFGRSLVCYRLPHGH